MPLLYLDYNCFQRGFDDLRQPRIRREAEACQRIFALAESGQVELVWSFMHDDEMMLCPFQSRLFRIRRLAKLCRRRIAVSAEIYELGLKFQFSARLSAKDAAHLACAALTDADAFLTCDDSLTKRSLRLKLGLPIINPFDYIP